MEARAARRYAALRGVGAGMADGGEEHRRSMNLAAGMVAAEADCTIEEAFTLMRERAAASGTTMEELVARVLDRSVRFD